MKHSCACSKTALSALISQLCTTTDPLLWQVQSGTEDVRPPHIKKLSASFHSLYINICGNTSQGCISPVPLNDKRRWKTNVSQWSEAWLYQIWDHMLGGRGRRRDAVTRNSARGFLFTKLVGMKQTSQFYSENRLHRYYHPVFFSPAEEKRHRWMTCRTQGNLNIIKWCIMSELKTH